MSKLVFDLYRYQILPINRKIQGDLFDDIKLDEDLKEFAKDTNASKTTLEISSDSKAPLNIDESIERLSGAVAYASSGGGNISIKVRNLKKRIQTNQKIKTISLEEVDIIGKEKIAVEALKTLIEQEILEDNN